MPCRRRCPHAFTAPYSDSGFVRPRAPARRPRRSSPVSHASRTARRDGGRDRRAWKVRGEIAIPCPDSARHTGTTPNTPATEAMNAQITAVAGLSSGEKTVASVRIEMVCSSSRFLRRSSSRTSCDSAVLTPGFVPASTSACRTHLRTN